MRDKNIPRDGTTFADLGMPFPLFEAPVREAHEYAGVATCDICGRSGVHCFELDSSDGVIVPCTACGADNSVAFDALSTSCRVCHNPVPGPARASRRPPQVDDGRGRASVERGDLSSWLPIKEGNGRPEINDATLTYD